MNELQTNNLKKGDCIRVDKVETIVKAKYGTSEYGLKAMGLAQYIEKKKEEEGEHVTVIQNNGSLEILDDEEASVYHTVQFFRGMKKMARANYKHGLVDTGKLSDTSREVHIRNQITQSRILQAAKAAKSLPK